MSQSRVQLFATCLGDLLFPEAVADAEQLLRRAGYEVEFPAGQVYCGQPAFNSGHRAARRVARTFARAFSHETPIVVPSGSCATMAVHYLPEMLGCESFSVLGALVLSSRGERAAPAGERGSHARLSRLLPHAARASHREAAAHAPRALGRPPCSVAPPRPLLRLRRDLLGTRAGGLARHGRRQA